MKFLSPLLDFPILNRAALLSCFSVLIINHNIAFAMTHHMKNSNGIYNNSYSLRARKCKASSSSHKIIYALNAHTRVCIFRFKGLTKLLSEKMHFEDKWNEKYNISTL